MIVLWGLPADQPIAHVMRALTDAGQRPFVVDQRRAADTRAELVVDRRASGSISIGNDKVELRKVRSIYARPYDPLQVKAVRESPEGSAARSHAQQLHDILRVWTELTEALVVHRLSAMGSNGSKPYQADEIRGAGFDVPETLVTTDVAAVEAFVAKHGEVVYKSVSGVRSMVSRLTATRRTRLRHVATCPTQFQQYIAGVDHRVHVVGKEVFAAEIRSDVDDYRYAGRLGGDVQIRETEIPDELAERCRTITRGLGLVVAGIDLRRTADGRWYCFEVNPSPAFTFYDRSDGAIARAVAKLLIAGRPS
jgi:glutathione synthase/RimK-type ligase-like ATP-grasp enzyme